MSTQASAFPAVPFSITTPSQNLRLLELPPDLLELITSDNRPEKLSLKSSSNSTEKEKPSKPNADEYLHLCTVDKIWAVRQVSTSNAVYVTRTQETDADTQMSDDEGGEKQQQSTTGITAFAQVNNTLELTEKKMSLLDVENQIRRILPVYSDHLDARHASSPISTMEDLDDAIQAPTNLIHRAVRDSFVFSFPSPAGGETLYIPSDALLLASWTALMRCATIMGLQPDLGPSSSTTEGLLGSVSADDGDGLLLSVVARRMLESFVSPSRDRPETEQSESRATVFLGRLVARCAKEIKIDELLDQWRDLVPGGWSGKVSLEDGVLGERYVLDEGEGVVRYVDGEERIGSAPTMVGEEQKSRTAETGAGNKRKWHEKFGKQRDQR